MDLNVPTIAQRKAARRTQLTTGDTSPTLPSASSISDPAAQSSAPHPETNVEPQTNPIPSHPAEIPPGVSLDKEELIALARKMGLELAPPKKIWIKHSYSVTPESKEKFSKYCDVLGIKMQDGLEEAFQDWFKKKEAEFKAVSEAKNVEI